MPPNAQLGALSNDLFFWSVLLYSFALLGYAAEFAYGRLQTVKSARVAAAAQAARAAAARPLVPALAGAGVGSALVDSTEPGGHGPTDPTPDLATPAGRAARRAALRAETGQPDGRAAVAGQIALTLTVVGWVLQIGEVTTRGLAAHAVPWGDMYGFSSMICLLVVTIYLGMLTQQRIRHLGVFVLVPVVLYMGLAGTVLYVPAGPLVPALDSYWIYIHVVAAMVASAIFMLGVVFTSLYLIRERHDRLVADGRPLGGTKIGRGLPAAAVLDRIAYRTIAFAFPIWTFAIIAGAIWAEAAWGRYWGWDPKETWSFITWVVYAVYLHARSTRGWRGRRAAMIALVGFACLAVDYYAVNLWIAGLHSYAGPGLV